MPRFDLEPNAGESILPEYFEHPAEGYLSYDPNTLYINPHRDGQKPISHPIMMVGKFFGTKQPGVPTCSEPGEGNKGCQKWYGCPMKKYAHIGPGTVIMEKHGTVTASNCYDYFETTRGGRATSQNHYGLDGYKLNTSRTTIDVLGRTAAVAAGKLNEESSRQGVMASKPQVWQMEIGWLLAPWWPLMKKKGLELPPTAEHFPELTVDDDEPVEKPKGSRPKKVSA